MKCQLAAWNEIYQSVPHPVWGGSLLWSLTSKTTAKSASTFRVACLGLASETSPQVDRTETGMSDGA